MKIYTKIFIGMALGAVAGFGFGPRSPLFTPDLIVLSDAGSVQFLQSPGGAASEVKLPPGIGARLSIVDQRGKGRDLFYHVQFVVSKRQALKDPSGRLKAGSTVKAWVNASAQHGKGASAACAAFKPVSGFGFDLMAYIYPIGLIFLRLIKMIIVPLVFASLLVGVASLGDIRKLGRLGGKTLGYFFLTTGVAISIGLALANIIRPGDFMSAADKQELMCQYAGAASARSAKAAEQPSAVDNLLNIIPANPAESLASGEMLQIIFFAAFLGIALTLIPKEKSDKLVGVFDAVNDAMVMCVNLIMKLAPYGVFALVANVVGQSGISVLKALGVYSLVVMAGLAIHAVGVYTSVVRLFGKISMADYWRAIRPAQLIAFSTSSSSATLPLTMKCAEKNLGVSNQTTSFVLPLGATVNMDGTALYQGVAAVFIAQVFNIHLTLTDQLTIVLTATMASVGAAGVPGVGMVTLAMVLTSIGVPTVGVALILGVDRVLDMFRTATNVTGDLSATVMVAATEGEKLAYCPPGEENGEGDGGEEAEPTAEEPQTEQEHNEAKDG